MKRRRGPGCIMTALAVVAICAVAIGIDVGGDYVLFAPWAYGILGQPTLTGNWYGVLRTHGEGPHAFYLELERSRNSRGIPEETRGQADIEGHVSWCARGIPQLTSTVFGHANRSASSIVLETAELRRPPLGLYPLIFRGAWHNSTLVLHVSFSPVGNLGYGGTLKPVPLTLHKKSRSVYQAACAHI